MYGREVCRKGGTMVKELLLLVDDSMLSAVAVLFFLLLVLTVLGWDQACHTLRIYNWDGRRYRFLGRERMRKRNDTYVVSMHERVGETSRTTLYLLLASDRLVRKSRYENLLFRAGKAEVWLPIEKRMRAEVLFAYR